MLTGSTFLVMRVADCPPHLRGSSGAARKTLVGLQRRILQWEQLLAMGHHFAGNHSLCTHEDLPSDHPTMKCEAQIDYLLKLLKSLSECMDEILSPFGALDVNSTESCHAVLRLYREKGRKWGFLACCLGEVFGFLHW
jgi:hypothetical protein